MHNIIPVCSAVSLSAFSQMMIILPQMVGFRCTHHDMTINSSAYQYYCVQTFLSAPTDYTINLYVVHGTTNVETNTLETHTHTKTQRYRHSHRCLSTVCGCAGTAPPVHSTNMRGLKLCASTSTLAQEELRVRARCWHVAYATTSDDNATTRPPRSVRLLSNGTRSGSLATSQGDAHVRRASPLPSIGPPASPAAAPLLPPISFV